MSQTKHSPNSEMAPWLWIALPLATAGIYAVWGGLMNMIIARQIAELVPDSRASAVVLGSVMGMGAMVALVAQPVMGSLSDRTPQGRLGRRNIWILWGSIATAIGLVAMAFNTSIGGLTILFPLVVMVLSGAHAALTTVLPERVPPALQGKMSGVCGSMTMLGVLLGISLTGYTDSTWQGYLSLSVIMMVTGISFALTTREKPLPLALEDRAAGGWRAMIKGLPGLSTHRDFWLTFVSRFAVLMGYNIVVGFNLFLLKDHIGFGGGNLDLVSREATKVMTLSTIMLLIFSLLGGLVCDFTGRIRIFVIGAALALVPTALIFSLVRTLDGYYWAQALMGAAFGVYMAVDAVLIARVLPSTGNAARDLGVLNVANSGPQALAPMLAGALVATTGNYMLLFVLMAAMAIASALAAYSIRSVQ